MDLKLIDEAVAAYKKDASESDTARLEFFRKLYEIQQNRADAIATADGYEPLPERDGDQDYIDAVPLLSQRSCPIDSTEFAQTCSDIAQHMADNAGLEDDVAKALRTLDWSDFCNKADLEKAGSMPPLFVEDCLRSFDDFGVDAAVPANIFMMVVSFAIRAHIQDVAAKAYAAVSDDAKTGNHARPLVCPVCGAPASLSVVESGVGIDGRARTQYCGTCGTAWPFDRLRCGVCGTQNPSHLHYFHIEGDSAHRLLNCEECGQYERVVFEEDLDKPLVNEVEDVVMARLDRVALDPRFRKETAADEK